MNTREAQLQAKVTEQEEELVRLRRENELLRQKIDLLSRKIFGCSSEKLSPGQLQLLLELAGAEEEETQKETPDEPRADTREKVSTQGTQAAHPRPPARHRRDRRSRTRQSAARQGAALTQCAPARSAMGTGTACRAVAAEFAGTLHRRPRSARSSRDQQILRSSSALPAGTDFQTTIWRGTSPANTRPLDRSRGRLVETNLRTFERENL